MDAWAARWLESYNVRASTRRQAAVHLEIIRAEFGARRIAAIRPSDVKVWVSKLQGEGRAPSYVYALHSRLRQVMQDALHDGLVTVNPCSRRTAPPMGRQRPYVASTEQVWALYDRIPVNVRGAVLLGAFAGLRVAEAAALRVEDVNWLKGMVSPVQQWPDVPLKTSESIADIPVPRELCQMIAADLLPGQSHVLRNDWEQPAAPWVIERKFREAADGIEGLPDGFRYHDLRHHYAVAADPLGAVREGGAGASPARVREDDSGHVRAHLAGHRRVRTIRHQECADGSCGQSADIRRVN